MTPEQIDFLKELREVDERIKRDNRRRAYLIENAIRHKWVTQAELARTLDISRQSVMNWRIKLGIPPDLAKVRH